MLGTAWRASAIPFPGGPAPTGNGRQRRPGKRHGRRMLCGKTPGERTRRSSSRLRAGERFFWQRLHGTPAAWGGRPLNASARAGRLFTVASEERFFFGSACMAGRRIGPAARLTPRSGWVASSRLRAGGTLLLAASKCTSAARADCPLNVAARVGHLLAAAGRGNNSFGSACMAGRRIGPAARQTCTNRGNCGPALDRQGKNWYTGTIALVC